VIVEVVSEATRRVDEFEKRLAYLAIVTLGIYLLVEQNQAAVLVYRRNEGDFEREVYQGLAAVIALPEIECQMPLTELYANVRFPSTEEIRERQEAYGS
jgi:Uma2 family endonuclease